jgi:hypothetical protein
MLITYNEKLSSNHRCSEKEISITYSEYVSVALLIQYSMHMRRIMLSSEVYLVVSYISTLSHKRHDFRVKLFNIKYVH